MLAHALAFHGGRWTAADVAALRASRPEFQEVSGDKQTGLD